MKIEDIASQIESFIYKENIYIKEPMSKHTTIKIGGPADIFIKIKKTEEIIDLIKFTRKENIPLHIIGNGSNLLVKDGGIRGIVAKMCTDSFTFLENNTIKVEAGMLNAKLARILLDNSLAGFEFASRNSRNNRWSSKNECRSLWQANE